MEIGGAGCPRGCGRCNLEEKLAPSRREEPDRNLEKDDDDDDKDGGAVDGDAVIGDDLYIIGAVCHKSDYFAQRNFLEPSGTI